MQHAIHRACHQRFACNCSRFWHSYRTANRTMCCALSRMNRKSLVNLNYRWFSTKYVTWVWCRWWTFGEWVTAITCPMPNSSIATSSCTMTHGHSTSKVISSKASQPLYADCHYPRPNLFWAQVVFSCEVHAPYSNWKNSDGIVSTIWW